MVFDQITFVNTVRASIIVAMSDIFHHVEKASSSKDVTFFIVFTFHRDEIPRKTFTKSRGSESYIINFKKLSLIEVYFAYILT